MPVEVFGIGGGLGAIFLGRYLYYAHDWPLWQCILVGLGILGIALLLNKRFGMMPPTA